MKTNRAVIFDLGNVLIDYDNEFTIASIATFCHVDKREIAALLGMIDVETGTGRMNSRQLHRYLMERTGATPDFEQFEQVCCVGLRRNEEALDYAVSLRAQTGVSVGIISNTVDVHARWLRTNVPELLTFDAVLLSTEVGLLKPDPAIYQLALTQMTISSQQALFVDDLLTNVAGAEAMGIAGIQHVSWESTGAAISAWLNS